MSEQTTETKSDCSHENLVQLSTIYARTSWTRQDDGSYTPDEVPCSKVLEEETTEWRCNDCGVEGTLEDDVFVSFSDDDVPTVLADALRLTERAEVAAVESRVLAARLRHGDRSSRG